MLVENELKVETNLQCYRWTASAMLANVEDVKSKVSGRESMKLSSGEGFIASDK